MAPPLQQRRPPNAPHNSGMLREEHEYYGGKRTYPARTFPFNLDGGWPSGTHADDTISDHLRGPRERGGVQRGQFTSFGEGAPDDGLNDHGGARTYLARTSPFRGNLNNHGGARTYPARTSLFRHDGTWPDSTCAGADDTLSHQDLIEVQQEQRDLERNGMWPSSIYADRRGTPPRSPPRFMLQLDFPNDCARHPHPSTPSVRRLWSPVGHNITEN